MTHSDALFELRSARPSMGMRLVEWILDKRPAIFPDTDEGTREYFAARKLPHDALMPHKFEQRFDVERWDARGQRCVTLHPPGARGVQHILYFHGGGFVLPMNAVHWPFVARLAECLHASITVPLYDLVPESPYSCAEGAADEAYARIAAEWDGKDIILAGDSAGGQMALALALRLKAADAAMPGRLVLLSPWLDLTLADTAARAVEPKDVMLNIEPLRVMGEMWAGERDAASPQCSPLYADLEGLPPTAIFQGRHDLFVVDCRNFMARAQQVKAPVKLYEYAGAPHVYMLVPFTRESRDTVQLIGEFCA